jgi:hypothetical protein
MIITKIEYACQIVTHPIHGLTGKANGHNSMTMRKTDKRRFCKWEFGLGSNQWTGYGK